MNGSYKSKFYYDSKRGGVFAPEFKIVPYPAVIMRRQAIYDALKDILSPESHKKYIEIGYGTGIFAYEFYRMGLEVYGYDISDDAFLIAQELFNSDKQRLKLKKQLSEEDNKVYDIVGAYEVLEHIVDDVGVLQLWKGVLRDGGLLLFSVPSRMKNFGLRDKRGGHIRRYEKDGLRHLLEDTGFEILSLVSYGYPFPRLNNWLTTQLVDKPYLKRFGNASDSHKTSLSGIQRHEEYKFRKIIPHKLLVLFSKIQRVFYSADLGIGYIVLARKR